MFRPAPSRSVLAVLFSLAASTSLTATVDATTPSSWTADNGDGSYTNPLFYDEFSDPDLIRVGEDYYLTGTTMHSMPGLPLLHSRDLVNWELKSYALEELDLGPAFRLEDDETIYGQGIWAPCLRYHDGTFHIFANVNGQTTQHFTATDPAGPWTHRTMKRSLHDLSVLFEDDGRAFVVWGYREIRFAQLNEELDDIVPGTERVLIPADAGFGEGAHFYKFKGRYYITCSNYDPIGYMACARADRIEGPYEITTISAAETFGTGNGWRMAGMGWGEFGEFDLQPPQPHQMGAIPLHQGGIVDTPAGEWWAVSMTDQNSLGRLTGLSPITWEDGWPYFGLPGNLLRTPRTWIKPTTAEPSPIRAPYQRDDTFDGPELANVWQWNHVPVADAWSLESRRGFLRLQSLPAADFWFARNTLTQRAMGPESIATAIVDPSGLEPGDRGGLALVNYPYAVLGLTREAGGGLMLERVDQNAADPIRLPLPADADRVWLRAHCNFDTEQALLSYSTDGKTFTTVGKPFTTIFQLQTFQGVRYGLFNYTTAATSPGHLDFDDFAVEEPRSRRSIPFGREITLTSRAEETPLGVWRGRLRLQANNEDGNHTRFRVIDRGLGRVALQSVSDGGYVTVTGLGGPADVKVLPHLDPERSSFQWNHMMQGDVLLMSLVTNRYLNASSHVGGLASADSPGANPDRKGGATFLYEVHDPAPVETTVSLFDLEDVTLLNGPFKHAQDLNESYLLALEADRLLAGFRLEAGLEPRAPKYSNWESSGLDGHTLGHYLTALAQTWIATENEELKRRLDYTVSELATCQTANGNGYVGAVPNSRDLWAAIAAGQFGAQGFSLGGAWVPWYNVHKTFAGLRDAWQLAGNAQARDVLVGLADWCGDLLDGLTDEQVEAMMRAEHGGMAEVLADVSAITGDQRYLRHAQRFSHRALLDPLLRREDTLTGQHANTQIPKVIGFARIAELGGDPTWDGAAHAFWDLVRDTRSVAFGGNSTREHFNAPDDFSEMIRSREGPETCNTYNMLRLTEALYRRDGDAKFADYYERAMFNHILSTQHPEHGGFVYFTPLRPRHYRVYSQPSQCFWCCVGSGIENHGKYGKFIYAADDDGLRVNLFIASELNWAERGITVEQQTQFPDEAGTTLKLSMESPESFALRLRHPTWVAGGGLRIRINGEPVETSSTPSSFATIERTWRDGDTIELDLPMRTVLERLPDGSNHAAFLHGPILLAARTGTEDLDGLIADDARMAHVAPGPFRPINAAPMLVGNPETMAASLAPVPDHPLHFTAAGLIRPNDFDSLELEPFYRIHDARYMMYWRLVSESSYENVLAELEADEAARLALAARTVDLITPGEQQPEVEHNFRGEDTYTGFEFGRAWRAANDWFGYELNAQGEASLQLRLTHWGYAWQPRTYQVEINGMVAGTVNVSGRDGENFVDHHVTIPAEVSTDAPLRVIFRAAPDSSVPPLYEVRLIRPAKSMQ
jgi:uncharacterized protein